MESAAVPLLKTLITVQLHVPEAYWPGTSVQTCTKSGLSAKIILPYAITSRIRRAYKT